MTTADIKADRYRRLRQWLDRQQQIVQRSFAKDWPPQKVDHLLVEIKLRLNELEAMP